MSGVWAKSLVATDEDLSRSFVKSFSLNTAQVAATYDICTASGGNVLIESVTVYSGVVTAGLTSVSIQTNDTTAVEMMSAVEGAVAGLTGGKNIKRFTTETLLASGKKIQGTIVGTGTGAGTLVVAVKYRKLAAGADIA